MKTIILSIMLTCFCPRAISQNQQQLSKIVLLAFYNLENFYDTKDNSLVDDNEFTPTGVKHYDQGIYQDKILHLATVIQQIGYKYSQDGAAILGVVEIENDTVLQDLVSHPLLRKRHYQVIHFDSKDKRGIDVALLYNPKYFKPLNAYSIPVKLPVNKGVKFETRDILLVKGSLDGDSLYVLVNHWPSKRGGEDRTAGSRNTAAITCRKAIDQILKTEPKAKIIVMGDFNDNPDSYAIAHLLGSSGNLASLAPGQLYNPWLSLYEQGRGTLANQDSWSLFDQILISPGLVPKNVMGYHYQFAGIYQNSSMIENSGRYRGYPMRTWDGNNYRGGFSDHFPTYIVLLQAVNDSH